MALAAVFLSKLGGTFIDVLSTIAILTGLITIAVLAPVDSPSAPVISPHRRKKLKILSLAAFTVIMAAIIFFRQGSWVYAPQIQVCLILSVLWISFMLSKPGHRAMCLVDKIKLKEV